MIDILFLEQKIKQMQDNLDLYVRTIEELALDLNHYQEMASQLEQAMLNQRSASVVSIDSRKSVVYDCKLVNGYIHSYQSKIANYTKLVECLNKDLETLLYEYKIKTSESLDNVIYLDKVKNARK